MGVNSSKNVWLRNQEQQLQSSHNSKLSEVLEKQKTSMDQLKVEMDQKLKEMHDRCNEHLQINSSLSVPETQDIIRHRWIQTYRERLKEMKLFDEEYNKRLAELSEDHRFELYEIFDTHANALNKIYAHKENDIYWSKFNLDH